VKIKRERERERDWRRMELLRDAPLVVAKWEREKKEEIEEERDLSLLSHGSALARTFTL